MTNDFTDTVTTADDFEETLETLLAAAVANDVPIEGGWSTDGVEDTTWDVVITEVAPADD
ncbi:MAG TPA: hypothetical protein VJ898_02640 [Natrialbaceae archaeon]|nr:hypothetical protein [Natrialbaceae archaeon]